MQDLHPIIGGGGILGIVEAPDLRGEGGGTCGARQVDWRLRPHPHPQQHGLRCPRCDSPNTKFCYYNNYNLSQPRHYCKSCRRYWTKGGVLRNVPVGGGCRKSKRSSSSSKPSRSSSTKDPDQWHPSRRPTAGASSHLNSDSSSGVTVATDASDAPLNAGPLPDDSFDASVLMMMKSVDEASPAAEESSVDGSAVTLADGAAFPSSAENHVKGVFDYGFPDLSLLEVGASAGMGRMGQTVQADPPAPLQGSDAAAGLSRMDWQLSGLGATDAGIFDLSGGATETNHAGGGGCFWSDGHWGDTVDVDLDVDPSLYTFPE